MMMMMMVMIMMMSHLIKDNTRSHEVDAFLIQIDDVVRLEDGSKPSAKTQVTML